MNNNELYHYGILGMKWGVKRASKASRIEKRAKKKNWSEDAETAAKIKTKNVKQMSNAELRKLNERLQLEKQYSQLTKKETIPGQKFVGDVVRESAKDTAKSYVTKYMKKGIESAISSIGSKK